MDALDKSGVRIIPSQIKFVDTEVNKVYRTEITVKNISKTSKSIRYYKPNSAKFAIQVTNPEIPVAPGLEVPAYLEYRCDNDGIESDRIIVTVDGEVLEVPITCSPSQAMLSLDGPVNFDNVVANSKVISRTIYVHNRGAKSGEFKIVYNGRLPIAIQPDMGTVQPRSSVPIKVEYVTKEPREFSEVARVYLQGVESSVLPITGNVVQGSLELLDLNTQERLACVRFGSIYYGTDRLESAILYNNGPEPACFVAMLNEDAVGQEVGIDLTKSTNATLAAQNDKALQQSGQRNELSNLVTAIPNQGMLAPYEQIPIVFCFSPRWLAASKGFRNKNKAAPRQDFAVFIQIKTIGSSDKTSNGQASSNTQQHVALGDPNGSVLEVALTGTALPVQLSLRPQSRLDFGTCRVGEHVDALCTLRNDSNHLGVTYQLRKCAHFSATPNSGKISCGQSQDVIFSFTPNQIGTFKPIQYLDVLGKVSDSRDPYRMIQRVIHSIPIELNGTSDPVLQRQDPVYNPGITPKITNEVGLFVNTTFSSAKKSPRNAMLNAQSTKLHRVAPRSADSTDYLVAFPNDRSRSVRPSDRRQAFKTVFTRTSRHTYVDPDYTYTDEEAEALRAHKEHYLTYLRDLSNERATRIRSTEYTSNDNGVDLAMQPASGLKQKKISLKELEDTFRRVHDVPESAFKMMSVKELAAVEKKSAQKLLDGLNAIPTTSKEKSDCSQILSPQELHKIIIGPPTVDFKQVCLRSTSQRDVHVINNLNKYIHVAMEVDCRELRQTSPLSQVVPPMTKAVVPLIFESNMKGRFQRSLDYKINNFYKNHITVFAEVVPVALEMNTSDLVLSPAAGQPAEAGIRGVVRLSNKLNHPAEFTWNPILTDRGTAFSVRPATGVVDGEKDLDCEVVFHPSYMAPDTGDFQLQVHGGNTLRLHCSADLGQTNVSFLERRVMFGVVPLHLTTTRTAMLKNSGPNHAFFQVLDPSPFPGLFVSPLHGVVPVGGTTELKIHLTPNAVMKFDTRIEVAIRGWKTLDLRLGGNVEEPSVNIDMNTFNLGGVYVGSSQVTLFNLTNKANTRGRVEFDMSRFADFTLKFPGHQTSEDINFENLNPGIFAVSLEPRNSIEAQLVFSPTEVASYDFIIPVTINQTTAPTPMPTPLPPTPAPCNKNSLDHIINPRPVQVTIATPRKKVVATALRQPLEIAPGKIDFTLTPKIYEMAQTSGLGNNENTVLTNRSDRDIKWAVDLSGGNQAMVDGVFKFIHSTGVPYLSMFGGSGVSGTIAPGQVQRLGVVFCPAKAGYYECVLPVIIDDDYDNPYQYLTLSGELKAPNITFDPVAIVLTPVPLDSSVTAEFSLMAYNYTDVVELNVTSPKVECEDGSTLFPLTVTFTKGQLIEPGYSEDGYRDPCVLYCRVSFSSARPVSFCQPLVFTDSQGNSYSLPVTATADNCLLTCYPFLAQHRIDHQFVCQQGYALRGRRTASKESVNAGEAVLVPVDTPQRPSSRPSTTCTSSNFEVSSSSYEESSQSLSESSSTPRDGALNKVQSDSELGQRGTRNDLKSRSLGSAMFPEEDSEEGIFHVEVLMAAQRWFSHNGWPGGPNPITVPDSLRAGVSKKPPEEKATTAKGTTVDASGGRRENKTVYDMISHLCGKQVPGIPLNNPLPRDEIERAKQVYWQHATMLTFLRTQGACLSSVKPEYLMMPEEYNNWLQLQRELENMRRQRSGHVAIETKSAEEDSLDEDLFEAVSKRAWTDVLLQILKTLVLSKITPRQFKSLPVPSHSSMPTVDPDPLCSNVYSLPERMALLWLNHNYEQHRREIWKTNTKGGVPSSRWIVNFDYDLLDGLVLGAVLGAHAPFLVDIYLGEMYTQPATAEQCLHNALKVVEEIPLEVLLKHLLQVVNAIRHLGIDYDIQAIDITDPNPLSMLLLCVHLYTQLPQYLPKSTIEFVGSLHAVVMRQIKLSNPSSKSLTYQALLVGKDAKDFTLPKGNFVTIPPKSTLNLSTELRSRFIHPTEAVLVLVGRRQGANVGTTLVFNMKGKIDNITPKMTIKIESSCYEKKTFEVNATNPFSESGEFHVIIIEADQNEHLLGVSSTSSLMQPKKRKPKKVLSKIDNGRRKQKETETEEEYSDRSQEKQETETQSTGEVTMRAFSSASESVYIESGASSPVELRFLPFNIGKRQCSVVFTNDKIGEFLYSIEALATAPRPSVLPFKHSSQSVRVSSAAAAGSGRGAFGGNDQVMYWKVEVGKHITEQLSIPVTNASREAALVTAAQQQMDAVELDRRRVTGTLSSGSITAKAIEHLSNGQPSTSQPRPYGQKIWAYFQEIELSNSLQDVIYRFHKVTASTNMFKVPPQLFIPEPEYRPGKGAPTDTKSVLDDGIVLLPISFEAKEIGHYPCEITLSCDDDMRVYNIECTVIPEGNEASIEFASPVHKPVTQHIPVVNATYSDWTLHAHITGSGFSGPATLVAPAARTTNYPLVFKPPHEGNWKGKLVLLNSADGAEHVFHLNGTGEKPLPLEQISINCETKESVTRTLPVPNATNKKLYYSVETDLDYVSGPDSVTVLPGKVGHYELTYSPLRRGSSHGVISFIASANPAKELDSDGDELECVVDDSGVDGYRVWYKVDLTATPAKPTQTLTMSCHCQRRAVLEIGVTNPMSTDMTLTAEVKGMGLSGPDVLVVPPNSRGVYQLMYAPAIIGEFRGSLVFYHESVGEFWYDLKMEAVRPEPTSLPHMECELGRWVRQDITLNNPTDETLDLVPKVSNLNNFNLERDSERPIQMRPQSSVTLPLTFMPSAVGKADHHAKITFLCEQLGEWVFLASGSGLLPQPQDPMSITALAGSNSSVIIPFRNAFDLSVIINIELAENSSATEKTPFCLLLKKKQQVRLGPKSILDIPLSFAPEKMRMYEVVVHVHVQREDGAPWIVDENTGTETSEKKEITWQYPVRGFPELYAVQEINHALLICQARRSFTDRLEVTLTGVAPSAAAAHNVVRTRAMSPQDAGARQEDDGVVVTESITVAQEFTYELFFPNADVRRDLQNCVQLELIRKTRHPNRGVVTLTFSINFTPLKTMSHEVELLVQGSTGGLWRFPLRFVSTEPDIDDTIIVEAAGLNKLSTVGINLSSQTEYPLSFHAYFVPGSDAEFGVSPAVGDLPPLGQQGLPINIHFRPDKYGKVYMGKLVIQTMEMQWTYAVRGVLPDYIPPRGNSSHPMAGPHTDPRRRTARTNYVRENMKLTTTGVSSPIKGGVLLPSRLPAK